MTKKKSSFHFSTQKFVMKNECDKKIFQCFPGTFFMQLPGLFKKKKNGQGKSLLYAV